MYYWDSLWVVKGLLVSGMGESARHIVANVVSLVERYGFMPNGSRSYYINRRCAGILAWIFSAASGKASLYSNRRPDVRPYPRIEANPPC
jgi:alpha,alpha-trehalase